MCEYTLLMFKCHMHVIQHQSCMYLWSDGRKCRGETEILPAFAQKQHHPSSSVRQETLQENEEENEKCG